MHTLVTVVNDGKTAVTRVAWLAMLRDPVIVVKRG